VDQYLVRATHGQRLERWLGAEQVNGISRQMKQWYGPPIPIAGVPGRVYACGGGEFCGPIKGGYFSSLMDFRWSALKAQLRATRYTLHAFASLSALITAMTTDGKKQTLPYIKVGVAQPAVGSSNSLARQTILPGAAAIAAAPAGGTVYTKATAGAMPFVNPSSGTTHLINWFNQQSTAQNTSLMLMDQIFGVQPNYNSTSAQSITGVPTRYATAALAPGNVLNADVTTTLAAVASNVTITYVDDAGNTAEAGTAQALRTGAAAGTSPFTAPEWYYRLNAGDRGVQKMTSFQLSAAISPGAVDRLISHPLAIMPGAGIANQVVPLDGINSAISFERIYDDAFLTLWEWMKSATASSTHAGHVVICST
jgi:hypothetical protein